MSWVKAELKKRAARTGRETGAGGGHRDDRHGDTVPGLDSQQIRRLWDSIAAANKALPAELKLPDQVDGQQEPAPDKPPFSHWLRAPNGAGLGFNGEGIRYYWPQPNKSKSNNFWIRWEEGKGYRVMRRRGQAWSGQNDIWRFNEARVEYLLKCLVTSVRVKPRALRVRRFWLF